MNNRNTKFTLIVLFIAFIFIGSCKKDDNTESGGLPPLGTIIMADNVVEMLESDNSYLIYADSSQLIFTPGSSIIDNIEIGEILQSNMTPAMPYGYLRKVTSISTDTNGNKVLQTVQCPLNEAIKVCNIRQVIRSDDWSRSPKLEGNFDLLIYDDDSNADTENDQMRLEGSYSITPEIIFDLQKSEGSIFDFDYARIGYTMDVKREVKLKNKTSISFFEEELGVELFSAPPFLVGPLLITPEIKIQAGFRGSVNGEVEISTGQTTSTTFYYEYKDNSWQDPVNEVTSQDDAPSLSLEAGISADFYLKPQAEFKVYEALGANSFGEFYIKAEAEANLTNNAIDYCLEKGINAGIGVSADVFGVNLFKADLTVNLFEESLLGDGFEPCGSISLDSGSLGTWQSISAGNYHTIGLKTDGTLWGWGSNLNGQLGNGVNTISSTPVQIGIHDDWRTISAGNYHTVALKTDGTLWIWGKNSSGQLGNGTNTDSAIPIQIGVDDNWQNISGGVEFTVALKTDGTIWGWGANNYGQLGNGTSTDSYIPIQIGTNDDWQSISAGGFHTISLKTDGTLWGWGINNYGQLGNGTTIDSYIPIQIGTNDDWQSVSAGGYHTISLKTSDILWSWGWNNYGQLGNGTSTNSSIPIQVGQVEIDDDWQSVFGGYWRTLALKTDGTLWAWGKNSSGQLGNGTYTNSNVPIQIGADNDWQIIANGTSHTLALKTNGILWAWGDNIYGQLGNGTTVSSNIPIQIE